MCRESSVITNSCAQCTVVSSIISERLTEIQDEHSLIAAAASRLAAARLLLLVAMCVKIALLEPKVTSRWTTIGPLYY